MKIIKRDGTPQEYNFDKIIKAVTRAFNSILVVDKNLSEEEKEIELKKLKEKQQPEINKFLESLKEVVEKTIIKNNGDGTEVEEIQDVIQKELIKKNKYDVVEAFILYRKKHEEIRENKSKVIKDVDKALKATDIKNQNANLDEGSFGGRLGEAAGIVAKNAALKHMSKMARKNHEEGFVYIHDLDHYEIGDHNCLSCKFDDLLRDGFKTRQTTVRGANSVNTAMQLIAVIFQLQSLQQFGGVAATHLDWTMVPYVRKSFYKHYNSVIDIIPFLKNKLNLNKEEIENISIKDEIYTGKHWYSFVKRYVYRKAIKLVKKETHQAVEGMYHNLNTLQSRSGNQLPFTSINYGTCTLKEGRMITKSLLEVSIEGLGKNNLTSIFPCGIFQYKKGINDKPGTPNYDLKRLALKSDVRRIYPNWANCDWSNQTNWFKQDRMSKQQYINNLSKEDYNKLLEIIDNNSEVAYKLGLEIKDKKIEVSLEERPIEYFSTMGCRTVNGLDVNAFDNFKQNIQNTLNNEFNKIDDVFSGVIKDGRGNICPCTVILPTIAMESKIYIQNKYKDSDEYPREELLNYFIDFLDKKIGEAKDMLIERFNHICSQSPDAAKFMWENHCMAGYHPEEGIKSALKHGTIVIGQLGMAEALQILLGCDQTEQIGMETAKRIEQLFLDRTSQFKKEYKLNFGVYYTPAENLCYTAMKKFRQKYGIIKNVSDHEYFTNSIHVPVWYDFDAFKKIDIESQLTGYSNAGCITYVEVPSTAINNIDAIEALVDYAMEHDIPYFALNFPLDYCEDCGAQGDFNGVCPKCGSTNISELRRVTGYLSTTKKHFNKGKQAECDERKKHFKN